MPSTVLILGMGEEDKETELLPIGRVQFILWFHSKERGGRDIYWSLLKSWPEQRMCVKCLKMPGRKAKDGHKEC